MFHIGYLESRLDTRYRVSSNGLFLNLRQLEKFTHIIDLNAPSLACSQMKVYYDTVSVLGGSHFNFHKGLLIIDIIFFQKHKRTVNLA